MTTRALLMALPVAAVASAASAQVTLTEVARFQTFTSASANPDGSGANPEYVGLLTSVAWDGSRLFIGGIEGNNIPGIATPGIVEILNIDGETGVKFVNGPNNNPAPTDIQFGTPFAQNTAGSFQGYYGMDINDGVLVAAYDFGGSGSFTGDDLKIFDVSGASPNRLDDPNTDDLSRFPTGPASDPGFQSNGVSAGPAAIVFSNTNGRQLYSPVDGSIVTDFANGFPVVPDLSLGDQSTTLHRDFDIAANGDAYIRAGNLLRYVDRTGDETANEAVNIGGLPVGLFVSAQNLEYAEVAGAEDLIVVNDRPTFAAREFTDNVQFFSPDGTAKAVTVNFLEDDGTILTPEPGGAYDFDYDPATQTLAVSDLSNNHVSIFQVADASAGDLDGNTLLDALDVDVVSTQIGTNAGASALATADDTNSDGVYEYEDVLGLLDVLGVGLGDVNFNGLVEQGDLNVVLNNWGTATLRYSLGDYNGSGLVEQGDLNIVLNNWGSATAPDFSGSAVPEPATAALLALSGLALRRWR